MVNIASHFSLLLLQLGRADLISNGSVIGSSTASPTTPIRRLLRGYWAYLDIESIEGLSPKLVLPETYVLGATK